ncbi:DUF4199 domain-containing protein [Chitinophaga varians]|uniref:DUF4199 domain-containing protein n=1 Tax=Chitinophaga varians TaxID=2202339 RepID=A0A847RPS3_9BACT|nr:DUF4199 domain-containing protein [Chitinophaga varians]NLR62848.1 DUF4199 domain-containing protein [Chitinophaga varians]
MQESPNPGVKWGFIAGAVLILLNVATWKAGPQVLFSFWNSISQLVLLIIFAVLAGRERKKQVGKYIGFKTVIRPVYTTFVLSMLMVTVYQFVLYKYIDPSLSAALKADTLVSTERTMRYLKAPQDIIDQQLEGIKAADFSVSIAKSFLDYLKVLIFYFGIAAIVSLFLRKKAPEQQHS